MKAVFFLLFFCCVGIVSRSQEIPVIKFSTLDDRIEKPSEKIKVINFWATFCAPCIKELPMLEQLEATNPNVDVLLVSLDFADNLEKVKAFAKRKNLKSEIVLLDEIDYNSWIDRVDKSWSGAIPATLVIYPSLERVFISGELKEGDLEKAINKTN